MAVQPRDPGPLPTPWHGIKNPKEMLAKQRAVGKMEGGLTKQTPKGGAGNAPRSSVPKRNIMPMPMPSKGVPRRMPMPMPLAPRNLPKLTPAQRKKLEL